MYRIKRNATDALFSDFIRWRDDFICQRCFAKFERPNIAYHCSHFHSRSKKSTRFDPLNAVGLCYKCHEHFTAEDTFCGGPMNTKEHKGFIIERIGEREFDLLAVRANTPTKLDEKTIRMGLKLELKALKGRK